MNDLYLRLEGEPLNNPNHWSENGGVYTIPASLNHDATGPLVDTVNILTAEDYRANFLLRMEAEDALDSSSDSVEDVIIPEE